MSTRKRENSKDFDWLLEVLKGTIIGGLPFALSLPFIPFMFTFGGGLSAFFAFFWTAGLAFGAAVHATVLFFIIRKMRKE